MLFARSARMRFARTARLPFVWSVHMSFARSACGYTRPDRRRDRGARHAHLGLQHSCNARHVRLEVRHSRSAQHASLEVKHGRCTQGLALSFSVVLLHDTVLSTFCRGSHGEPGSDLHTVAGRGKPDSTNLSSVQHKNRSIPHELESVETTLSTPIGNYYCGMGPASVARPRLLLGKLTRSVL